jgi:hypothetical protein
MLPVVCALCRAEVISSSKFSAGITIMVKDRAVM